MEPVCEVVAAALATLVLGPVALSDTAAGRFIDGILLTRSGREKRMTVSERTLSHFGTAWSLKPLNSHSNRAVVYRIDRANCLAHDVLLLCFEEEIIALNDW